MIGKITHYGIDTRDHLATFQRKFYNKYAKNASQTSAMTPESLGKNLSCCVYERNNKNYLICFDGDDGSGGTPSDCKINWWKYRDVLDTFKIDDYAIFKMQYADTSDQKQFYPFKYDVYPLAMMTNHPEKIISITDSLKKVNKDVDVVFVGGRVHEHNRPFCWPKNRNINQWWPGNRKVGYEKLIEIKNRRKDLVIELHDGLLPQEKYYDLINRSKICIDFPGIGLSSRKFYEFSIMGKCILSLKQNESCIPYQEWETYASIGRDYDWNSLENTIDTLLKTDGLIDELGNNAFMLRKYMTHEYIGEYVVNTIDEHIDKMYDVGFDIIRRKYM